MSLLSQIKAIPKDTTLGRIIGHKVVEVEKRASATPISNWKSSATPSDRSLQEAIVQSPLSLIAEVKRKSPSKGAIRENLDVREIAEIYGRHASAVSVLADEHFFGGSLPLLRKVRMAISQPVLLKDFVISEYQLYEGRAHGADAALLMVSVLESAAIQPLIDRAHSLGMDVLLEVHDEAELEVALETSAKIIGINNRNLHSLEIDLANFDRLIAQLPEDRLAVAESGFYTSEDLDRIRDRAHAVLIGTSLMASPDVEAKIRELGW